MAGAGTARSRRATVLLGLGGVNAVSRLHPLFCAALPPPFHQFILVEDGPLHGAPDVLEHHRPWAFHLQQPLAPPEQLGRVVPRDGLACLLGLHVSFPFWMASSAAVAPCVALRPSSSS